MKVFKTGEPQLLEGRTIAVIGYGNQGRAQALNLRDAGHAPVIGLRSRSSRRRVVSDDGLTVATPRHAAGGADIVFILTPDETHAVVYENIAPALRPGGTLVFAHASSVHFGTVVPRRDLTVLLLAPLGPGKRLRELRCRQPGVACFVAVARGPARKGRSLGLALAHAIGCLPAGAIETTFAEEAVGDLFGEQAVLCGGLAELLKAGVGTLIEGGHSPEKAYLECVYQIDLIVDLIKAEGLDGMYRRISPVAAHGALTNGPSVIGAPTKAAMKTLHGRIASGRYFRDAAGALDAKTLRELRRESVPDSIIKAERAIRRHLGTR